MVASLKKPRRQGAPFKVHLSLKWAAQKQE
jgi:hypothetical protein